MKTENWKLKIVFFFLLFTPLQAVFAASIDLQVPIGTTTSVSNLPEYIKAIYEFGVAGAGILAAIMIMVGGFLWLTAAGNATQVGNAKSYISSAILGLVLALTSYMILNLINPKLVSLEMPVITPVERMASDITLCCKNSSTGEYKTAEAKDDATCEKQIGTGWVDGGDKCNTSASDCFTLNSTECKNYPDICVSTSDGCTPKNCSSYGTEQCPCPQDSTDIYISESEDYIYDDLKQCEKFTGCGFTYDAGCRSCAFFKKVNISSAGC